MTPVSDAAKSIMISGDVPVGASRRKTDMTERADFSQTPRSAGSKP
jgi:hypothetical protein